ncbi:MAG: LysR family transcriptional regulator [Rhizobiaceae bacterium]|nr:LysR family transcriptional regulator [Rhizobiaceae bacterium]
MRNLRQFVIVADCGSITRAAARLNISQPTLSRTIKNMEAQRGVELFERHGEGVTLTKYGRILYSHAVGILNEFDRANEEIRHLQGSNKSSLRISAGDLWGYVLLPDMIREFSSRYPDVEIDIDIVGHAPRLEGLRNGTYDLAFGIIDESAEALYRLTFLKLRKFGFTVFGDKNHPLRTEAKVTKRDLEEYRWVNHQFEFGLLDIKEMGADGELPTARDYAIKGNTLLNTIQIIKGSELLISASTGFEPLFETYGLSAICLDTTGLVSDSGAVYWGDLEEKPIPRRFVDLVTRRLKS